MEPAFVKIEIGEGVAINTCNWGHRTSRPPVICVHGLTRNARDFDWLARDLAQDRLVIAVDIAGRGQSDWLDDKNAYRIETYASHMATALDHWGFDRVNWIGTSMGGLIGILVAAVDRRIQNLILNDIGPFCHRDALSPIKDYLGLDLSFPDLDKLEMHLRFIHAGFGALTDAQWRHLARHSSRTAPDGGVRLGYDPEIRQPLISDAAADIDLWAEFDRITARTLTIRGAQSFILDAQTAALMQDRGAKSDLVTLEGIGHAPSLMAADQIALIRRWLDA